MASTTQVLTRSARKRPVHRKFDALSMCPVGGAGWCAYPFTITELDKKVKQVVPKNKKKDVQRRLSAN